MSKKRNKIAKLTEEQYNLYIAGLRNNETENQSAPFFDGNGNLVKPEPFDKNE